MALPQHSNERSRISGCRTLQLMAGAGLDAPPPTIPPKYSCTNYFVQLVPFLYLACTGSDRFCPAHPHVQLFFRFASATLGQERNMERFFQYFRDDRFALTTLQNPNIEVRTYAQLVQAAQQEREWQARAAQYAAPQPLGTPGAPDSIPTTAFPENVASAAPAPLSTRHFLIGCAAIRNARNSPEN